MRKKGAILILCIFVLDVFLIGCSTVKETETVNGEVNLTVELDKDMFQTGDEITITYENLQLVDVDIEYPVYDEIKSLGRVSIKQALMIDGEENPLFPTFDDPDHAFNTMQEQYADELKKVKKEYFLLNINKSNVEKYHEALNQVAMENINKNQEDKKINQLIQILDIYEGAGRNQEIIALFEACKANKLKPEEGLDLIFALPSPCPASEKYREKAYPNKPKPEYDIEEK